MSINSAAGFLGNPGISMIVPAIATRKPAPADNLTSLIVILNLIYRYNRMEKHKNGKYKSKNEKTGQRNYRQ